jgi:hypothetical protein
MRNLIQDDVSNIEASYGLDSNESIFGSAGVPRYPTPRPPATSSPTPPSTVSPAPPAAQKADPYGKCRPLRNKKKRRRCVQRVRRSLTR